MAKATTTTTNSSHREASAAIGSRHAAGRHTDEEQHGLLAGAHDDDDDDDEQDDYFADAVEGQGLAAHAPRGKPSSPSLVTTPRTPRTPNRVRFDLRPTAIPPSANGFHDGRRRSSSEDGDLQYAEPDHAADGDGHARYPLLTDIEAPSVTLANSPWGADDDVHSWAEAERARPKSGLKSAFMNMANSIIGAGIIGQPYAFRQAGLLAGVVLLVGLTVVVDWTIRLIVINSKLSGANSFQGTVEHCFGKPGLIAISVAQWAFAFGGMVAFGVIVGDSIPHVLEAIWPGLRDMPVLGLLADRRVVIAVFILGVSYPLTLYRDISKAS